MTSIIEKLKLTQYEDFVVLNQPEDVHLFNGMNNQLTGGHEAIFIFVEDLEGIVKHTERIIKDEQLKMGGYLFFAYPKKGNKRYSTFVHRDEIFPALTVDEDGYVGDSDLKFSRMVSMDDVFTVVGLRRLKKKVNKTAASQSVGDYEHHVKDIERILVDYPKELSFYQNLTPGYQKGWARHVFSVKQPETRAKRIEQMISLLREGYKSLDLYRQQKK